MSYFKNKTQTHVQKLTPMCCPSNEKVTDLSVGVVFSGRNDKFAWSYLQPLFCPHCEPQPACARQLAKRGQGLQPKAREKLPVPFRAWTSDLRLISTLLKATTQPQKSTTESPFCLQVTQIRSAWQPLVQVATRELLEVPKDKWQGRIMRGSQSWFVWCPLKTWMRRW